MNLTDNVEKERQILKYIAVSLKSGVINPITDIQYKDDNVSSYYEDVFHGSREYIKEYAFDSIIELKKELTQLWQNEDFMREFIPVVLAAVFKKRKNNSDAEKRMPLEKKPTESESSGGLPTYIYNF